MKIAKEWHGLQLQEKINRAAGRAIVGIAQQVVNETKRVTHVDQGTLRRSVHAATPGEAHLDDESTASTQDMSMTTRVEPEHTAEGPMVEVGSWLDYACVEWIGRGHPGITQGLEVARGMKADAIVAQAFAEEGLRRGGRRSGGGGGVGGNGNFAEGGGGVVGELRRIAEREARGSGA